MQKELREKSVLAMYDVRGIQRYIFGTNEMRDIIGASVLVENIILDGMNKIIARNPDWDRNRYLTDWEHDDAAAFFHDKNIQMQVMFIGGGNAYVLFRQGTVCEQMNRLLAKYILEETYSLNLAVAVVEKTDSYAHDYQMIHARMREIKAAMPETKPTGAMPFMAVDTVTGYPLAKEVSYSGKPAEYICTEAALKRAHILKTEGAEKVLDNMVTGKGDSSFLAVIHIDGNNMGGRVKQIMADKQDYRESVVVMRKISMNIKYGFRASYAAMEEAIRSISDRNMQDRKGELYRKIIAAGDDITFVCNAGVALLAAETFLQDVANRNLYEENGLNEAENRKKYGFSACAGIAFFHSHFPFRDAYEVAEACCASAKGRAKEAASRSQGRTDGAIGCFLDYQICTHSKAANLDAYRERQYRLADERGSMIFRPCYVPCKAFEGITDLNERNRAQSMEILWGNLKTFKKADTGSNLSRSKVKMLRNAYALGMEAVRTYITFLRSRDMVLPDTDIRTWYDALEIMDICELREEGWNEA